MLAAWPGVPEAGAGAGQPGLVVALADAALAPGNPGPVNPGLVNPGLAKPAPVSSRARAAAASVDVLSSAPRASGFTAPPELAASPELAAAVLLPDFAVLAGADELPVPPVPLALAALSELATASAALFAADLPLAAAHTESLGTVTSERAPSSDLAQDGGLAASATDEPFLDSAWTVFAWTV